MSEDRPLTEFADEATPGNDGDSDPATAGDSDGSPAADTTEPAAVTYRWQPDGASCAACGGRTERQWFDDGAFVCPDCKQW